MTKKAKSPKLELPKEEVEMIDDSLPFIEDNGVEEVIVDKKKNENWLSKVEAAIKSAEEGESVLINQYLPQSNDYMECKKIREEIQAAIAGKKIKVVSNGHILLGTTGFSKESGMSFKYTVMNTPVYVKK